MQAKELKAYLLKDNNRIYKVLEHFGFHDIWENGEEIRCATPTGNNRTSVVVRLSPELFATCFSSEHDYRGDILGLLENISGKTFGNTMREIHQLFNLSYSKGSKNIDLLKDIRKYKRGAIRESGEIKKFDKSILNRYLNVIHESMLLEAISPAVMKQFDIRFDPISDRVIFPH